MNSDSLKVGYTFDAGPNACLYLRKQHIPIVCALDIHVLGLFLLNTRYNNGSTGVVTIPIDPWTMVIRKYQPFFKFTLLIHQISYYNFLSFYNEMENNTNFFIELIRLEKGKRDGHSL